MREALILTHDVNHALQQFELGVMFELARKKKTLSSSTNGGQAPNTTIINHYGGQLNSATGGENTQTIHGQSAKSKKKRPPIWKIILGIIALVTALLGLAKAWYEYVIVKPDTPASALVLQMGSISEEVYNVNVRLLELGYKSDLPTKIFDQKTLDAVNALQNVLGWDITEAIDGDLYQYIISNNAATPSPAPTSAPTPTPEPTPEPTAEPIVAATVVSATSRPASPSPVLRPHGWNYLQKYEYVEWGSYPQDNEDDPDPILWRVLYSDDSTAILLSEKILEARNFNDTGESTWIDSSIRKWLNKDFIDIAFPGSGEKEALVLTSISEYPEVRQDNLDFVSLPSMGLLLEASFGFSKSRGEIPRRSGVHTKHALNQGFIAVTGDYGVYLTSTPFDKDYAYAIRANGAVGQAQYERRDPKGIRPVIVLDLNKAELNRGDGTFLSAYSRVH